MKESTQLRLSLETLAKDQRTVQSVYRCSLEHYSARYFLLEAGEDSPLTRTCGEPGCDLVATRTESAVLRTYQTQIP